MTHNGLSRRDFGKIPTEEFKVQGSRLDVRCSMFDVGAQMFHSREGKPSRSLPNRSGKLRFSFLHPRGLPTFHLMEIHVALDPVYERLTLQRTQCERRGCNRC